MADLSRFLTVVGVQVLGSAPATGSAPASRVRAQPLRRFGRPPRLQDDRDEGCREAVTGRSSSARGSSLRLCRCGRRWSPLGRCHSSAVRGAEENGREQGGAPRHK
ncbi:hypothetical protein GDO81_018688 [Engystomops pustulosus]|uniref:Secreted protein n=1 Tax=Engystomops pustulosus TaxID=76066 RepID=A0AAV6YF11_ENGPU|nr:hypothetical protein GDO81_018688 [Engystomops pustulosus]